MLANVDSLEVDNIPENYDKTREVEDDEEEDNSKESVYLVVVVWPLRLSLDQHQQSNVTEAEDDDRQNCPEEKIFYRPLALA